jgi:hypothetical protein
MRAHPVEAFQGQAGLTDAIRQDPAHGVRMQRGIGNAAAGADAAEQRAGTALRDLLPGLERQHRAGFRVPAARQADLGPLPRLVGFSPIDAQAQPVGDRDNVLDVERNQFGAAQGGGETDRQQGAVAPARAVRSQVASSWRSMSRVKAAAFSTGRPYARNSACSGSWMSRWPGFHGRSLKRCGRYLPLGRARLIITKSTRRPRQ